MRERIRHLIAATFGLPAGEVPEDASPEALPAWDSLHHLELMMAIEMEFDVQISSEAMADLISVGAIEDYLREQGVSVPA